MTLFAIFAFLLGAICMPALLFIRARRDKAWDDSNLFNIYRIVAYLGTHPGRFSQMRLPDGSRPFWYTKLDETELTDRGPDDAANPER